MVTRTVLARALSRGNGTPVADGLLRSTRLGAGLPHHLAYVGNQLPAALTAPPDSFFASIPPSSRAAMRRPMIEGNNAYMNELQPIHMQSNNISGRASRSSSRIRKRGADGKVLTDLEAKKIQIVDQQKQDAAAAAENVLQKSHYIDELKGIETDRKIAADRAWRRASSLATAAGEFATTLEEASSAARVVFANNKMVMARDGLETSTHKMRKMERNALYFEKQAEQEARETKELYEEGLLLANEREDWLSTTREMLEEAEEAHADAQRVAVSLEDKASRAETRARETRKVVRVGRRSAQASRQTGMGRGVAPLLLTTGVMESASFAHGDQDKPKAKRARR